MESKKLIAKGKILVIAPNINDSIIAAAIMNRIIDSRDTEKYRQNIETVFVDKNSLSSLSIYSGIERIYLIGIGSQNCTDSCLLNFLVTNRSKIYFWANNQGRAKIPTSCPLINAMKRCVIIEPLFFEQKSSMVDVLMDKFRPKDIPEIWLNASKNLANHNGILPDSLANRFKRATYSAEVMMQYEDAPDLMAITRHSLMHELFYGPNPKIDEMVDVYLKIKRANDAMLGGVKIKRTRNMMPDSAEIKRIKETMLSNIVALNEDCGLIPYKKQIFNRHKIFGYFLAHLHVLAVQYEDAHGNHLTEIRANKAHIRKLERIAANFENRGFKISFNGSKLVITYNWEEVKKIIIEELGR